MKNTIKEKGKDYCFGKRSLGKVEIKAGAHAFYIKENKIEKVGGNKGKLYNVLYKGRK